jgi:hypothetical protein
VGVLISSRCLGLGCIFEPRGLQIDPDSSEIQDEKEDYSSKTDGRQMYTGITNSGSAKSKDGPFEV